MSRFFAAEGSSSDSDDSSSPLSDAGGTFAAPREDRHGLFEALSFSEEDESGAESDSYEAFSEGDEEGDEVSQQAAPVRKSRFMFDTDSESDEEGSTQRQVKSQKEKAREEMESLAELIHDSLDEKDWIAVQESKHLG